MDIMLNSIEPRKLVNLQPMYVEDTGRLWASQGYKVVMQKGFGEPFQLVGRYNPPILHTAAIKNRLSRRLCRSGFHFIIPMMDGSLIGFVRKRIVKLRPGEKNFQPVFEIPKGSRALGVCRGPGEKLFWGEYPTRQSGEEICIYGSCDCGEHWEKVYTFKKNEILHIHNVIFDPIRQGHWVLTGDNDSECKIAFANDDFGTLEIVKEGSQQYRSVCAFPVKEGLIYATDTPLDRNYIYLLEPETSKLHKLAYLPASVFFGIRVGNIFVISTAHERSKVNRTPFVHLYYSEDGFSWSEFYRQKKDFLHNKYFQHGTYTFPSGPNPGPFIYAGGQAVKEDDGNLMIWNLNKVKEK